mmetsp:Transcript_55076/g.117053  ORF Transcript_55076/g.117053 Transcript_55076/m.117053 type:complete len:83 (-) Transcript_55076:439-687(-)
MKQTTAIALSTGGVIAALVAIMAGTGSAFVPAVPHQAGPSTVVRKESKMDMAMMGDFAVLDNPLVEVDEAIVPARKCAVCIG